MDDNLEDDVAKVENKSHWKLYLTHEHKIVVVKDCDDNGKMNVIRYLIHKILADFYTKSVSKN